MVGCLSVFLSVFLSVRVDSNEACMSIEFAPKVFFSQRVLKQSACIQTLSVAS